MSIDKTRDILSLNRQIRTVLEAMLYAVGDGAPVDGGSGTGVNEAPKGSLYFDRTNAELYRQTGAITSPVWDSIGSISTGELAAGVLSADVAGRALMAAGYFNAAHVDTAFGTDSIDAANFAKIVADGVLTEAQVLAIFAADAFTEANVDAIFAAGAIDGADRIKIGSITSDRLATPLSVGDAGLPARATLRVAANVSSAEKVTIGADVYEVEIVDTDSTDNTANDDFNNVTNPLVLPNFTTDYANVAPVAVGDLIRIENEIMAVTVVDGTSRTLKRGVSGTTAATHADGVDIFDGDGIDGGSTVAVGLVATLTPTAFSPALVADINGRGTEDVLATQIRRPRRGGRRFGCDHCDQRGSRWGQ
jgi:hypothetical protein